MNTSPATRRYWPAAALVALAGAGFLWFQGHADARLETTAALQPAVPAAVIQTAPQETSINSDGTARVSRKPDFVDIVVGVVYRDRAASSAQQQASSAMENVLTAVTNLKLQNAELQTGAVELQPRYRSVRSDQEDEQRLFGYEAVMTLRVRTTDLNSCARVVDAALGAGANRIDGIFFQIRDAIGAREEAIRLATQAARRKAQVLAEGLDHRLGRLITASSSSGYWEGWSPRFGYGNMAQMSSNAGGGDDSKEIVVPGTIEVWARVNVQYAATPGK